MELRQDFRAIGEQIRRLRYDPPAFRMTVAAVMVAIGLAGVTLPLGGGLEARRQRVSLAEERAQVAERLRGHLDVCGLAAARLTAQANDVEWGAYLAEQLRFAGLKLLSQQPPELKDQGDFKMIRFVLRASGTYDGILDFVDRIERGQRLIRIDHLRLELVNGSLVAEVDALGLAGGSLELLPAAGETAARQEEE
jgi:hypothetical protein